MPYQDWKHPLETALHQGLCKEGTSGICHMLGRSYSHSSAPTYLQSKKATEALRCTAGGNLAQTENRPVVLRNRWCCSDWFWTRPFVVSANLFNKNMMARHATVFNSNSVVPLPKTFCSGSGVSSLHLMDALTPVYSYFFIRKARDKKLFQTCIISK